MILWQAAAAAVDQAAAFVPKEEGAKLALLALNNGLGCKVAALAEDVDYRMFADSG